MTERGLVRLSWAATALYAAAAAAGVVEDGVRIIALVIALVLFLAGAAGTLGALVIAAGRSRTEDIAVGSLFLFQGDVSKATQRALHGATIAQTVAAVAAASARPYSSLAFGILVPIFGVACTGLWGARHGRFPARAVARKPAGRRPQT